jgi:hypothetical protein
MDPSDRTIPTLEAFLTWPAERVAECVRREKPMVCVFPINVTRRWFMLEYPQEAASGETQAYFQRAGQRHVELYRLLFDHGIDTLLTPIFGPELLERGPEYQEIMVPALLWFAQDPVFTAFYDAYDVRVHVYGDTRRYLENTPYEKALAAFDELAQSTAHHRRCRLFFGVCAHDPAETVVQIGVRFHEEHGRLPDKRQIIEAYYGEYVEPVDLFIGFDRPSAFDMPLVATGCEDLYFTVSPSPYMDAQTLRRILYDHLYARRIDDTSYTLSTQDVATLGRFYDINRHRVLGLGRKHRSGAFWYPVPQVELLPELQEE